MISSCQVLQTSVAQKSNAKLNAANRPRNAKRAFVISITAACLAMSCSQASAGASYNDSYTLQTSNQSMWGGGDPGTYVVDSGFQGVRWGSYAGTGPVYNNISAIVGSERQSTGIGCGKYGYDQCYVDTRTGAAISLYSSGQVGVKAYGNVSGGSVSAVLPIATNLTVGDKVNGFIATKAINLISFSLPGDPSFFSDPTNGVFHISGSNTVQSGASIAATAPSFKAGVDAIVNLDNTGLFSACVIFAGCSNTQYTASANPGRVNLVDIDSTKQKPVSVLGGAYSPFEFGKEYVVHEGQAPCVTGTNCGVTVATPALAVVKADGLQNFGGGSVAGNTVSLASSSPVLRLTADLTGIAQVALDSPVDLLNPQINFGIGSFSASLFDAQAGVQFNMAQNFSLNPAMMTALTFDKPVSQWVAEGAIYKNDQLIATIAGDRVRTLTYYDEGGQPLWVVVGSQADDAYGSIARECSYLNNCTFQDMSGWKKAGTTLTFNLADGADLVFDGGADGRLLSRSYSIDNRVADFSVNTKLSIDGTFPIRAGCFDISLAGAGNFSLPCAYQDVFQLGNIADLSLAGASFALGGFNSQTFDMDQVQADVPEPSSAWLILAALFAFLAIRQRRHQAAR